MATHPYIGIAALCEREERGPDGSLTLLGVVDRLVRPSPADAVDGGVATPPRRLVLRAYNAQPAGERTVAVTYTSPDLRRHTVAQLVPFDKLVVTITFDLDFDLDTGQALTIDISIDRELVNRLALPIAQGVLA